MDAAILREHQAGGTVGCARPRVCSLTVAYSPDPGGRPWNIATRSRINSRRPRTLQGACGTEPNGPTCRPVTAVMPVRIRSIPLTLQAGQCPVEVHTLCPPGATPGPATVSPKNY